MNMTRRQSLLVYRFQKNQAGATAIEYGLIAALIAIAIIGSLLLFGEATSGMYDYIRENVVVGLNWV